MVGLVGVVANGDVVGLGAHHTFTTMFYNVSCTRLVGLVGVLADGDGSGAGGWGLDRWRQGWGK